MSGGAPPRRAPSILLVDDDPLILKGYSLRLKGEGYLVTTAGDGYEALQAAGAGDFDLILLDLRMPYRNGAEILKSLRQRRNTAETPVYLLAQPGDADLVERGMREGADGVFEKARLGPREIVTEVQAALEGKSRQRGASAPAAPAPAPPVANVPSAVDEIARRFRRHTGPAPESPAKIAAQAQAARVAARRAMRGEVDEEDEYTPAPTRGAAASYVSRSEPAPQRAYEDELPAPLEEPPYEEAYAPEPPPPAPLQRTAPATAPVPVREAFVAPAPPSEPGYDTVLNRFMGASQKLAQAMGLPPDYLCPICKSQIALRLWPDPTMENGVQGHFFCPKCFGG